MGSCVRAKTSLFGKKSDTYHAASVYLPTHSASSPFLSHETIKYGFNLYGYAHSTVAEMQGIPESTIQELQIFQRQYYQLIPIAQLRWPPAATLKQARVQDWIFKNMFDEHEVAHPPPERYQLQVLKKILKDVENTFQDPEYDVGSTRVRIVDLPSTPILCKDSAWNIIGSNHCDYS